MTRRDGIVEVASATRSLLTSAARAEPRLRGLEWRVLAAVVVLTSSWSRLRDDVFLEALAETAGLGSPRVVGRELASLRDRGLIGYQPGRGRGVASVVSIDPDERGKGTDSGPLIPSEKGTGSGAVIGGESAPDRVQVPGGKVHRNDPKKCTDSGTPPEETEETTSTSGDGWSSPLPSPTPGVRYVDAVASWAKGEGLAFPWGGRLTDRYVHVAELVRDVLGVRGTNAERSRAAITQLIDDYADERERPVDPAQRRQLIGLAVDYTPALVVEALSQAFDRPGVRDPAAYAAKLLRRGAVEPRRPVLAEAGEGLGP